ncbi:MAG: TldD/PmbA family protein [Candidatus Hodarchaeota archaeon]
MENQRKVLLSDKSSEILNQLRKNGISSGEVFGAIRFEKQVFFSSTKIFDCRITEKTGYGIRFQKDGKVFFLSIDDINFKSINTIIKNSLNNPAHAYSSKIFEFANPKESKMNKNFLKVADPRITEISLEEIISTAKSISEIVYASKSPFFLNSSHYSTIETHIVLINSNDLILNYTDTFRYFQAQLIAGTKRELTLIQLLSRLYRNLDTDLESVIEHELEESKNYRKIKRVNANQILPVVLDSNCMCQIGDIILRPFLTRLLSPVIHEERKKISFSHKIDLIERSDDPNRIGSLPFDHEGTSTRPLNLIQAGNQKDTPLDLLNAKDAGKLPTGNSLRGIPFISSTNIYRNPPSPVLTNLTVRTYNESDESLIEGVKKGIMLKGFNSLNYFDIENGDFELYSTEAFNIKNGQLRSSTGKITVFGNIFELLSTVEAVGNKPTSGYFSSIPSLRISRMRILGKPKKGLTRFLVPG